MKRWLWALLGLGVASWLLSGCGPAATPSPTPAPLPSATLAASPTRPPTQTPAPTATSRPPTLTAIPLAEWPTVEEPEPGMAVPASTPATLTPTTAAPTPNPNLIVAVTPTESATPDPNLGVGAVLYEDKFEGGRGWAWPYAENEIAAFSLGGQRLNAVMKVGAVAGGRLVAGSPAQQIGDQQWQVTALTNLCYAKDEYGVLFRANAAATDGYLLKLSCEGKARLEALSSLRPAVLVDWTASPAIRPGAPAENTLLVWAAGDRFHVFVNGRHLFSATDKTLAQGTYGFFIYDRTNGGASVSFSKLVVRAVSLP